MPKPVLADTTMVGDWPDEDCDQCGKNGTQVIHWGPLAVEKKDQTATMFCRECWHKVAERYRSRKSDRISIYGDLKKYSHVLELLRGKGFVIEAVEMYPLCDVDIILCYGSRTFTGKRSVELAASRIGVVY